MFLQGSNDIAPRVHSIESSDPRPCDYMLGCLIEYLIPLSWLYAIFDVNKLSISEESPFLPCSKSLYPPLHVLFLMENQWTSKSFFCISQIVKWRYQFHKNKKKATKLLKIGWRIMSSVVQCSSLTFLCQILCLRLLVQIRH